jgi:cob(I)alamin adenosyltransferase
MYFCTPCQYAAARRRRYEEWRDRDALASNRVVSALRPQAMGFISGAGRAMADKIYTKTGDDGTTGLFGGARVAKDSLRIESYGTVDELNSVLGLARSLGLGADHDGLLATIQEQLFVLGADLATPHGAMKNFPLPRVTSVDVVCLERAIDRLEENLPPLKSFILPGGSQAGAALHIGRTVCRRAERAVVMLAHEEPDIGPMPVQYLNRLSDLLFVLARAANHAAAMPEHPWMPRADAAGAAE